MRFSALFAAAFTIRSVLDPLLPRVVEETGGGYFELTRTADLAATFARVSEELHH